MEPNIYPRPDGQPALEIFMERCGALSEPRVLELGAKRSIAERSTLHHHYVPNAGQYFGTDIEAGADVDIVADLHELTAVVEEETFDVVISCSTFEHLKYPHLAAHEVMKVLKVGGLLFIETHQTFPLHAFPYDYFRFSREALAGLFGNNMGFKVVATEYMFPAMVCSPETPDAFQYPAFLNVRLFGEKLSGTPPEYAYEYDGKKPLTSHREKSSEKRNQ
ncbi:MAG: class I SAM-dependent methyltransferase [Chloroflexota bacterium]|nr:MAG: class I SAM-dependent methyltransferase [Chloroflexota bacterium]